MTRRILAVAIAMSMSMMAATSFANNDVVSCDTLHDSGEIAYSRCAILEWQCGPGDCSSQTFSVTAGRNYTQWGMSLMDWYVHFEGGSYNPTGLKLQLVEDSFNAFTGTLTAHVVANLSEASASADALYQVYFYVFFADGTNSVIKKPSTHFSCSDVNQCATPTTALSNATVSGLTFDGLGVQGFEFTTDATFGIPMHGFGFNIANATASGSTVTINNGTCQFSSDPTSTQGMTCNLTLDALSSSSSAVLGKVFRTASGSSQLGLYETSPTLANPFSSALDGSFGMTERVSEAFTSSTYTTSTPLFSAGAFSTWYDSGTDELGLEWGINWDPSAMYPYDFSAGVMQVLPQ